MTKPRKRKAVEIRPDDSGAVDEIVAKNAGIHIERMSNHGWYIGIEAADGSYWQFSLGAKNMRSTVEVRHTETIPTGHR